MYILIYYEFSLSNTFPCHSFTFLSGQFGNCLYINFHGPYNIHIMAINYVEPDQPAGLRAAHGRMIYDELTGTLNLGSPIFFFALIFKNAEIQRPTFILLGQKSVLHAVRIRCHVLQPDKLTNYPNYSKCAVPNNLCYAHPNQCQCGGLHTQLVDYEHIMIVCTENTEAGRLVSTMAIDPLASTHTYTTYALKDSYRDQIEIYKTRRRQMHGEYML